MFRTQISRLSQLLLLIPLAACSSQTHNTSTGSLQESKAETEAEGAAIRRAITAPTANGLVKSEPWDFLCVAQDLHTPAAMAVQPQSGHIFVSTKKGVIRIAPENAFRATTEIVNSPVDAYGNGPVYEFGPLGLCFIDSSTLIVGEGGKADGEDSLLFFAVGKQPRNQPLDWSEWFRQVGPIPRGDHSHRGEGNFYGICLFDQTAFVSSNGDDTKGWISRFSVSASDDRLTPFVSVKTLTHKDGPTGVVVYQEKLLVAQTGELNERPDSVLAIINPSTGEVDRVVETGLFDITSIAVSPDKEVVYVVDYSWADPQRGGLYSLRLSGSVLETTRHAEFVHPAGVTVTADGDVVVCCVEQQGESEQSPAAGKLYIHRQNGRERPSIARR